MLRVLQIAYYFPPMGGAGVQRALKFSKYLPEFGVQPVVLAAHDPGYVSDPSLAAEVPPGLEVHRIEHRPWLQRLLRWRQVRAANAAAASDRATMGPVPAAPSPLRDWVRDALLRGHATFQFPDDKAGWARHALPVARRLLREQHFDLILSSSPPVSSHVMAARLSREFGLPWVADYRDLWPEISSHGAPAWRRALDRRIESNWLRAAAGVVMVTPSWQRMLAERLGPACPVAFIPNGYDEADFASLPVAANDPGEFMLVHTGTFYGPRDPGALLDGVALYLQHAPSTARRLRLRLVGNIGARFDARLGQFDAQHPGVVERVPYLPHRDALAEMMGADALLLVVGGWGLEGVSGWLPGKIFEYLRSGKPVLMIGSGQGDAADLIRQHAQGLIVDESPGRIAEAIVAMVNAAPALANVGTRADVTRFERRELARQLAAFLVSCQQEAPLGRA